MKNQLALALGVVALAAFTGLSSQAKTGEKPVKPAAIPQPTDVNLSVDVDPGSAIGCLVTAWVHVGVNSNPNYNVKFFNAPMSPGQEITTRTTPKNGKVTIRVKQDAAIVATVYVNSNKTLTSNTVTCNRNPKE